MLTDAERARIAAAVNQAEAATSGEIVCVMAQRVSAYHETPLTWGAAAALLTPPVVLAIGLDPLALLRLAGGWTAGHSSAAPMALSLILAAYAAAQLVLFAVVGALVSWGPVKRLLTPRGLKHRRVRQAALAQLAAAAHAAGEARAAVVIFASQDDHIVEVLATEAVHTRAGQAVWDQAVAAVLDGFARQAPGDGFVRAVELCGAPLAAHFPGDGRDANTVSDTPLEL